MFRSYLARGCGTGQKNGRCSVSPLTLPAGASSGALGNFQHKTFVNDLVLTKLRADEVESKLVAQLGESEGKKTAAELSEILAEVTRDPTK